VTPAAPLLLTLDRGNSTLDAMLHGEGGRRARLDPGAGLAGFLAGRKPLRCVGSSVVPDGLAAAAQELALASVRLELVGRDLQCPLRLDYDTPATLGADRWLGALAAHRRFGRSIVVDCGSATTVNLVDHDGTFRGGAIAPGLGALAAGMAQRTPNLPPARPECAAATPMPARSSAAAVDLGVLLAFCGAVERLVAEAMGAARGPCTVVLTGGHAEDYLRRGRLRPVHEPDLVHQGLAVLAAESPCNC
jgi:type III pantothenate kinase